jgi:hypothetical protein
MELEKAKAYFAFEGNTIPDPAGSDERDRSVAHPGPSPVAAGGSEPVEPTPPPPPAPRRSMDEINAVPVPQRYLKQPDEPWRKFVDADGNIASPWFRPGG